MPSRQADHFRPSQLDHRTTVSIGGARERRQHNLWDPAAARVVVGSRGDTIQWFDARVEGDLGEPERDDPKTTRVEPLRFPGSPHPRWWQIEDRASDPTRLGADRSHPVTLLLFDLVMRASHAWYGFTWPTRVGTLSGIRELVVQDVFGQRHEVTPPPAHDWSLFHLHGTDEPLLLNWANAERPLTSDRPLEEVQLSTDEATGIVWAREIRVGGADLATPEQEKGGSASDVTDRDEPPRRVYHPVRGAGQPAHPYLPTEGVGGPLDQGRVADLSGAEPRWSPLPEATMLGRGDRHQLAAGVVSERGLRLDRRWVLGRTVDGQPILWHRRRRRSLPVALPNLVRFDQIELEER